MLKSCASALVDAIPKTLEVDATSTSRGSLHVQSCPSTADWCGYLEGRDQVLFHLPEWDGVFATYGLGVERFVAFDGERVVGVLPIVRQRHFVFGDQFVSLPWFDYTGVLADTPAVEALLVGEAAEKVRRHPDAVLQIRQLRPLGVHATCRSDKLLMRLELPGSTDELWSRLKPKVRNQIRKAQKSGVQTEVGGPELVDEFHRVYAHNMRDLGSPSHSRRFFRAIGEAFSTSARIAVARLSSKVVGAAFALPNGSVLEIPWASSLRECNGLCVNHALYWRLLTHAIEDGRKSFHFGRSTVDSGTYRFKKQWGAEPIQLHWYFSCADPARAARLARPAQERFGAAQRTWSRLPVAVTRFLGPRLISKIP